ncbi:hypothetical protein AMECASPLE_039073 [Ameca splendens]|uniref:Uncharacterized protein n=1 Tax=Ameca splendens TaxID=208324 RepID=A0ABV0ZTC2_9TELE
MLFSSRTGTRAGSGWCPRRLEASCRALQVLHENLFVHDSTPRTVPIRKYRFKFVSAEFTEKVQGQQSDPKRPERSRTEPAEISEGREREKLHLLAQDWLPDLKEKHTWDVKRIDRCAAGSQTQTDPGYYSLSV